ncbi:hypothetical protein M0802_003319 [Mischocyttarus mexicanus]|nr:hypothetical protein M0802_003319 [Mischocyttarus mexicanus]
MVVISGWVVRADMEDRLEVRRWCAVASAGAIGKGGDEGRGRMRNGWKQQLTSPREIRARYYEISSDLTATRERLQRQ